MAPLAAAAGAIARPLAQSLAEGAGQQIAGKGLDALKNAFTGGEKPEAAQHDQKSPVTF